MLKCLKTLFIFIMLVVLTGCKEKLTYQYMMRHPAFLQTELKRCNSLTIKTGTQITECAEVDRAGTDFQSLLNEQKIDPAPFGKRVMDAERESVNAKEQMEKAHQALQSGSGDLREAENKFQNAKRFYKEKLNAVKVMLAVISTHSPE